MAQRSESQAAKASSLAQRSKAEATPSNAPMRAGSTKKPFGKFQIPTTWEDETSLKSGTKYAIIGNPFPKENPSKAKRRASRSRHEIKRRAKKSLHSKPVKAKAKPGLVAKTEATKRKRVHRVVRGKPKPGHIVGHSQRRRK